MAPKGMLNAFDPTFQFLFGTFWSVLFMVGDDATKTLTVAVPTMDMFISHVLDPMTLLGVAMFGVFLYCVKDENRTLTTSESLAANWHLWNGIITYTIMDGFNGAFGDQTGFLPQLHAAYRNVDRRYRRDLVDTPEGPSQYEVEVARTVNTVELLVYSWMSVMVAVGICKGTKWHKTLEVMVLTMAAYGALVFVLPDYLEGCSNMQPMGVKSCTPEVTPFYFFFVYFGVIINWIWFVVPIVMLYYRTMDDFAAADSAKATQKAK